MKVDLQELKESVDQELVKLEKRRAELQERKEQIEAIQRLVHEVGAPAEEEAAEDEPVPVNAGGSEKNGWFRK
jgi:hypothetical protein